MFKKILKENILPVLFFISVYFYGIFFNFNYLNVSYYLAISGVVTSIVTTGLFLMLPAQFGFVTFGFMYISILMRGFTFAIIASFGFFLLPDDILVNYGFLLVATIILYKISLIFFINEENQNTKKKIV